jgi:hypothetical protein
MREISADCPGSRVIAKRRFDAVYSWPEQMSVSGGSAASFDRLRASAGGAFEQPAAAPGHQAVGGEGQAAFREVKGDVADGVAGDVDHPDESWPPTSKVSPVCSQARGRAGQAVGIGAAPSTMRPGRGAQRVDALDVVVVMVGDQDVGQPPAAPVQRRKDRAGFGHVDHAVSAGVASWIRKA